MRMILLFLGAALVGLVGASCEPQGCTLIGCGPSFKVELQRAAWTPGEYTVTVVADDETFECAVSFPLQCDAPPPCPEDAEFILALSGCAGDPAEHSLPWLEFQQGSVPAAVEVRVHQDGALLGEGAYTPEYDESHPNGPGCEPLCVSAPDAVLALAD